MEPFHSDSNEINPNFQGASNNIIPFSNLFSYSQTNDAKYLPALPTVHNYSDYVGAEWSDDIPYAEQADYLLAGACGLLSGTLSLLWMKVPSLKVLRSAGEKEVNSFVATIAKAFGYKSDPNDLQKIIAFLEKKFPLATDKLTPEWGGALQHHLRDFAHHPSPLGLLCSVLAQFTGISFGTNTEGKFTWYSLPKDAPLGKNFAEKIFLGTIIWALHLVSDMAGSSLTPGKGTGIPGSILSFLKEMSSLPVFQQLRFQYKDTDQSITISQWISKLFNGTYFRDPDGAPIRFDLRAEIGIGSYLAKEAIPVIINECLVRSVFTIKQLYKEIKKEHVSSVPELFSLDATHFLPFHNRILTRMCTVSSAVFVAVNMTGAAVKAASKGPAAIPDFLLQVNVVGIGRLVFACIADADYIKEDVRSAYEKYEQKQAEARFQSYKAQMACVEICKYLKLSETQNRLLLSLKRQYVLEDIEQTKKQNERNKKLEWLKEWRLSTQRALGLSVTDCFIDSESEIYESLLEEKANEPDISWFYILMLELDQFTPYLPLSKETVETYKGLKASCNYTKDVFLKRQQIMPIKRIERFEKTYNSMKDALNRGSQARLIAAGSTAAVAIVAAVGCNIFAPGLATLLVGNVFAGIHGIALTNASLALLGGGSLAIGGFGIAGGTAVLTGGGALVGLIGSGAISTATIMYNTSSSFVLAECAKMLTVCKYSIDGLYGRDQLAENIQAFMSNRIDEIKTELLTDTTLKSDKEHEKQLNECLTYLERSYVEVKHILEN